MLPVVVDVRALLALSMCSWACSGGSPMAPDGSTGCTTDEECDDAVFCNGTERCAGGVCTAGTAPCVSNCDEEEDRCDASCAMGGDGDGDGHVQLACGGDDCDDSDPNRFPGNPEVCDDEGHDEDCDQSTLGGRDDDADGYVDARCCNLALTGELTCGTDCDDTVSSTHPDEAESCNAIDDDCDGSVDEDLLMRLYYPDCDGDGFGDPSSFRASCGPPAETGCPEGTWVPNDRDCDDADPDRNPDAAELCDGVDNDCDGALDGPDEDDDGDGQADVACGVPAATDCDDRCPTCMDGGVEDLCDGLDQDCDGAIDEGVTTTFYEDADGDGYGGTTTVEACTLVPGLSTTSDDCDDREPRTPACHPRLACLSVRDGDVNVCGCRRRLRFYADVLDLETNTVVTPSTPRGSDDMDLISVSGEDPNQHVRSYTGVRMRSITPFDWLSVGPGDAVDLSLAAQEQMTSHAVVIVRSSGGDYKIGYAVNDSGGTTFVYAPLGAVPAALDCSP
jgi:hypothetical protein